MKKTLTLFFILISLVVVGQNWELIHLNQKYNYYHDSSSAITATIWVDSVKTLGADSIFYLNRVVRVNKACDSILALPEPNKQDYCDLCRGWKNQPQFLQRRVVKRTDGSYHFQDSASFVIYPLAQENEPWLFDTVNNITAMVISTLEADVWGVWDSLKIIALDNGGTIILSKEFGISQFPNFEEGGDYLFFGDENREVGIKVPGFWEFFDFEVGGVICAEDYSADNENGWDNDITKNTITSKQVLTNGINYGVDAITQNTGLSFWTGPYSNVTNGSGTLSYANSPNAAFNLYNGQLVRMPSSLDYAFEDGYYYVKLTQENGKYQKTIGAFTEPLFDVYFVYDSLSNSDELIPKCGTYFNYSKFVEGEGLVKRMVEYQAPDSLIGGGAGHKFKHTSSYKENANAFPDFCLPHDVSINELKFQALSIQPNPFSSTALVEIGESDFIGGELVLYNALGAEVESTSISGEKAVLRREALPAGAYFLKVTATNGKSWSLKVLITD